MVDMYKDLDPTGITYIIRTGKSLMQTMRTGGEIGKEHEINTQVPTQNLWKFEERRQELIQIAWDRWNLNLSDIPIFFDLRGRAAGQAVSQYGKAQKIRINRDLFLRYPNEIINDTLGHELAHAVVIMQGDRGRNPHGRAWQLVMLAFGQEPKRCHKMQTTPARRTRKVPAECDCGAIKEMGITRANKVMKGIANYRCTSCGTRIRVMLERV